MTLIPCSVLASLVLLAAPARAHLDLLSPPPRTSMLKQGPCGGGPDDLRGPTVATFKPGEKIVITWNEYVDHPGHYRIALDPDGQDDFFEPQAFDDKSGGPGVIMDGIADKKGGDYAQEITLPEIECDNCVLQVIQMMTDKAPYGDGNDLYYQCADIAIVGEVAATGGATEPGTTTVPDTTGASETSDGSAGDTGVPGETTGGETDPGTSTGVTTDAPTTDSPTSDPGTGTNDATTADTADTAGTAGTGTGGPTSDGASEASGCGCRGDAGAGAGWWMLAGLPLLGGRRRGRV